MKKINITYVVALAVIAVIVFPLGMIRFIAAETANTQVILLDGGEEMEFLIGAETVEGFFFEAGIVTGTHDRISHAPEALLWDGMVITIEREVAFYVQKDGGAPVPRIGRPGITVADVHRQLQQETDTALLTDRNGHEPITNGEIISFETWRTRYETEYIILPYETIRNTTSAVSAGRERLRVIGEEGIKAVTTSIVYIAGIETGRGIVGTETLAYPVDAILDIGTGWLGSLTDVTCPSFHYYRRLRMQATAYTAYYCCTNKHPCDPWFGITASGRHVEHGIVAVDRRLIPLGTRLYVENYGFAIAADVGGGIRGYRIDLYMYTIEEARRFGRRYLYVWVLDNIFEDEYEYPKEEEYAGQDTGQYCEEYCEEYCGEY